MHMRYQLPAGLISKHVVLQMVYCKCSWSKVASQSKYAGITRFRLRAPGKYVALCSTLETAEPAESNSLRPFRYKRIFHDRPRLLYLLLRADSNRAFPFALFSKTPGISASTMATTSSTPPRGPARALLKKMTGSTLLFPFVESMGPNRR